MSMLGYSGVLGECTRAFLLQHLRKVKSIKKSSQEQHMAKAVSLI